MAGQLPSEFTSKSPNRALVKLHLKLELIAHVLEMKKILLSIHLNMEEKNAEMTKYFARSTSNMNRSRF